MTTSPSDPGRGGAITTGVLLGLVSGLVAIGIEFAVTGGGYGSPAPGRMTELVTARGYHVFVSDAVRWLYYAGCIGFLIGFALAAWVVFARHPREP